MSGSVVLPAMKEKDRQDSERRCLLWEELLRGALIHSTHPSGFWERMHHHGAEASGHQIVKAQLFGWLFQKGQHN